MELLSTETACGKAEDFVKGVGPENARYIRNLCLVVPGVMPLLHLRLIVTIRGAARHYSRMKQLTSFLAEIQAIFHGAPRIVLSCRTVVMMVLRSDGKITRLSGQSLF